MTPRLTIYLELERLMMSLEAIDSEAADAIRDAMDPLWYGLSEEDRRLLDQRAVGVIAALEGLRVPVGRELRYSPADAPPVTRPLPPATEPITGWERAA